MYSITPAVPTLWKPYPGKFAPVVYAMNAPFWYELIASAPLSLVAVNWPTKLATAFSYA